MSVINRKTFYQRYRGEYGKLTQAQVNTYDAILDFWDSRSVLVDERWLAYIFATAFHETGRRMQAVREGFCSTDAGSIRAVTKMYDKGRIRNNYALAHRNGQSYFGRGLVQLTHGYNYKRIGQNIGLGDQLYDNPSLVLDVIISVKILCVGMLVGSFVPGHNLERYFNEVNEDWLGARKMINGSDKKQLIKGYALKFLSFIETDSEEYKFIDPTSTAEASTVEKSAIEAKSLETDSIQNSTVIEDEVSIYSEVDTIPTSLDSKNHVDILTHNEEGHVLNYDEFMKKDVSHESEKAAESQKKAMEPLVGQIIMFGGEDEPEGWMSCEGQKLSIEKYKSLYSVIGLQYGFDIESNTFSLPDLRDTFITKEGSKKMHFLIATQGYIPTFHD